MQNRDSFILRCSQELFLTFSLAFCFYSHLVAERALGSDSRDFNQVSSLSITHWNLGQLSPPPWASVPLLATWGVSSPRKLWASLGQGQFPVSVALESKPLPFILYLPAYYDSKLDHSWKCLENENPAFLRAIIMTIHHVKKKRKKKSFSSLQPSAPQANHFTLASWVRTNPLTPFLAPSDNFCFVLRLIYKFFYLYCGEIDIT